MTDAASRRLALASGRSISAIGQSETGAVYLVDLGSGELLKAVAGGWPPVVTRFDGHPGTEHVAMLL